MTQKEQLAIATTRISELESEIAKRAEEFQKLTDENKNFESLVEAHTASNAELTEKLEIANGKIFKLETEKATLEADKAKVEGEKAELEKNARNADTRAREIAARNGTLLPNKDLKEITAAIAGSKVMTREAFNTLSDKDKMAFCRAGGKLTDS